MRKLRRDESDPLEMDMTPMIDIVFNLLIFFMCATKFRTEEGMIQAFLPKDLGLLSTAAAAPVDLQKVRLKLLWVDASGRPTTGEDGFVVVKIDDSPFNAPGELGGEGYERSPVWKAVYESLTRFEEAYQGESVDGLPVIIDARPPP
jgi:hypothetical protein